MGRKAKLKGKRSSYPKVSGRFKKGDRVRKTYHYPSEKLKRYEGVITRIGEDFMDVRWDTADGKRQAPREVREWDYSVFDGGGPYSSPIKKVK